MELLQSIESRASVRKFAATPVPEADLKELVRRAGLAPSVNNSQPWMFVVVTNASLLHKMADEVHRKNSKFFPDGPTQKTVDHFSTFFASGPAVIFVATRQYEAIADSVVAESGLDHEQLNTIRHHPDIQSIGAAVQNILLSAVDLGYGACWLSGLMVARQELQDALQIRAPWKLATGIAIGKAAGPVKQKGKKPLDEILTVIR